VTAIVDRTAGLWGVVHGTEVLPLGRAHFRTGACGTGRGFGKERNNETIGFHCEESTEFVQPEVAVDWRGTWGGKGWGSKKLCGFAGDRGGVAIWRAGVGIVERFEVFLKLEW
jgi:hypothetical protein